MPQVALMEAHPRMYLSMLRSVINLSREGQQPITVGMLMRRMKMESKRTRDFILEMIKDGVVEQLDRDDDGRAQYLPTRRALMRLQEGVPRKIPEKVIAVNIQPLLLARWSQVVIEQELEQEEAR
jgi:hypothetical protein